MKNVAIMVLSRAVGISEEGGTGLRAPSVEEAESMKEDLKLAERAVLRQGLDIVLCGKMADRGLEELRRGGFLSSFMHDVSSMVGFGGEAEGHKDLWDHTKKVVTQADKDPIIRWAALFHDVGKVKAFSREKGKVTFHNHEVLSANSFRSFARRERLFREEESERIESIVRNLGRVEGYESDWTDSAVRRLRRELGDVLPDLIKLSSADITTGRDSKRQAILRSIESLKGRLEAIQKVDEAARLPKGLGMPLAGALQMSPSKNLGAVMQRLKDALAEGRVAPGLSVLEYVDYVLANREDFEEIPMSREEK